jgi:hypothetical protein
MSLPRFSTISTISTRLGLLLGITGILHSDHVIQRHVVEGIRRQRQSDR